MRRILYTLLALLVLGQPARATHTDPESETRVAVASRTDMQIKVDADLSEEAWLSAPVMSKFFQFNPQPGAPATQRSEVRILYDNTALYIGAKLFDTHPDSILKELTERDKLGNTDYFGIIIDAYQDGINGLGFLVTPTGIQFDTKYSALGDISSTSPSQSGDRSWDAVWDAAATITEFGWVVEIKIPHSALRFPQKEIQRWNINFVRQIRRNREETFWNPVDPNITGLMNQSGKLEGIEGVRSPLRLMATPFVTTIFEHQRNPGAMPPGGWRRSLSGGMDIKYGINDAFTLDMTLIPDFSEARSDNQVLNLTPFEVLFQENRQFFTEGVELFNKGDIFYSRRVGGQPLHYGRVNQQLGLADSLLINPQETQLLNATKVSGRTSNGLGIGFFNATSSASQALIYNRDRDELREVQTSPLTNYNVFVLDQNLRNNSFVSLINTNVLRSGADYDANVSGVVFNLRDKPNAYQVSGKAMLSQKYFQEETDLGHTYNLSLAKTRGRWQGNLDYNVESDNYDPNDLGFLFNANERSLSGRVSFNQFQPFSSFLAARGGLNVLYERLHSPNTFTDFMVETDAWFRTRSFFTFGVNAFVRPAGNYDYFEPRTPGRFYLFPRSSYLGGWSSSDYRKRAALDLRGNFRWFDEEKRYIAFGSVSPRFRFNDHFSLIWGSAFTFRNADAGFVARQDEEVIFGRRDQQLVENTLQAVYSFNNNITLNIRMRHYWTNVRYEQFHELGEAGDLLTTDFDESRDNSFNAFNIDAIFRWRFAPGSDLFFVWKNTIIEGTNDPALVQYRYGQSLSELGSLPQTNNFSLKVIYFVDYLYFVRDPAPVI